MKMCNTCLTKEMLLNSSLIVWQCLSVLVASHCTESYLFFEILQLRNMKVNRPLAIPIRHFLSQSHVQKRLQFFNFFNCFTGAMYVAETLLSAVLIGSYITYFSLEPFCSVTTLSNTRLFLRSFLYLMNLHLKLY
jgi:hypothetical protein